MSAEAMTDTPLTAVVYSKPACVQCNATYRALDQKGAHYETVDMSQDLDALEQVRAMGHMQAPVMVVRDLAGEIVDHWSGFNPGKITDFAPRLPASA